MPNDVHADASFLELCSLGELTPGMPGVVGAEMHRRVMEMLQAFFPGREKDVLAQLNALGVSISGSSMVRILAPAAPLAAMPITDLDLFAPMASEVATRDLLERLGYVAQKRLPGPRFYSGNGDAGTQPVQTCLPGTRYYSGYGPSTCIEAAARHGHDSSSSWHKVSSGDEEAYSNKIPGTLTSAHKGYGSVDRTARAKNRSFSPGVCGVIKFMHSATGRWIDLVGCSLDARTVVSHFHSTAVQNWISNGKVSSNYPEHLHDGTTIFAISHYDQYHGSGLVKLKRKWEKYGSAYREGPAEQAHTRELHFDAPALSVAPSEQSATPQIEAASGRTCRYGRRIRARPPYDRC